MERVWKAGSSRPHENLSKTRAADIPASKVNIHIKTLYAKDRGIDIPNHHRHGLSNPTTRFDTRPRLTNQGGSYVHRGWIRRLHSVRTILLITTQCLRGLIMAARQSIRDHHLASIHILPEQRKGLLVSETICE